MPDAEYHAAFREMHRILQEYAGDLVVVRDEPDDYYLDTAHLQSNGKRLFFAAARVGKRYVSFHLMPVYVWPDLLESASPALRKRMQGKSCFNFRRTEPELFQELTDLTPAGFERYRQHGYID